MNYRHAFHAGNHADVLKHVVLLALCDALVRKPTACFALDTHAGRGLYALDAEPAARTGEAVDGVMRLMAQPPGDPWISRYLDAIRACRAAHGDCVDIAPGVFELESVAVVVGEGPAELILEAAAIGAPR